MKCYYCEEKIDGHSAWKTVLDDDKRFCSEGCAEDYVRDHPADFVRRTSGSLENDVL